VDVIDLLTHCPVCPAPVRKVTVTSNSWPTGSMNELA